MTMRRCAIVDFASLRAVENDPRISCGLVAMDKVDYIVEVQMQGLPGHFVALEMESGTSVIVHGQLHDFEPEITLDTIPWGPKRS